MAGTQVAAILRSLPLDSLLQSGTVFSGLSKTEKLEFKLVGKNDETQVFNFDVYAFGVQLRKATAKIDGDDKVIWRLA